MIAKIKKIKMIISDIDGVWTDGTFYKGTDGQEFKKFNVNDGVGVAMAKAAGYKIALISGRFSSATKYRAKELKIEDVYNGGLNKIHAYEELKAKYNIVDSEIAYVGDDLIDIPVMEKVGVPIAVANAIQDVKGISIYTTKVAGGFGAFREAISWLINGQGRMEEVLESMREKIMNS